MSERHFEARVWRVENRWHVDLYEIAGSRATKRWPANATFDSRVDALGWAVAKREAIVQTRSDTSTPEWVRL